MTERWWVTVITRGARSPKVKTVPAGCCATGFIAHSDGQLVLALAIDLVALRRCLLRDIVEHQRHCGAEAGEDDQGRADDPDQRVLRAEGARRQQPDQGHRAGDGQHLRRRAGAGLPEQKRQGGQRPAAMAPRIRRRRSPVAPRRPGEQRPSRSGRRPAGRGCSGRRPPAVAIDRPRLADMAEPKVIELGRHAFEARQAMRPGERMEAGDGRSGERRGAQPMLPFRPATTRRGRAAARRRAGHPTARPATRRRRPRRRLA